MISGCSAENVGSRIRVTATDLLSFTSAIHVPPGQATRVSIKSPCRNTRSRAYNVLYCGWKKESYDCFTSVCISFNYRIAKESGDNSTHTYYPQLLLILHCQHLSFDGLEVHNSRHPEFYYFGMKLFPHQFLAEEASRSRPSCFLAFSTFSVMLSLLVQRQQRS